MQLYEIDKKINDILENDITVDEETGEVLGIEALDSLKMEFNKKIENTALYIKNIVAFAEDIKSEEKKLKARRTAIEHKADRLKERIKYFLDGNKFETPKCTITYRKSNKIIIDCDIEQLPEKFIRTNVLKEPDKSGLTQAIKEGQEIFGVSLQTVNNIQIK